MRFHKIELVGKFILQKLSGVPSFNSGSDNGRLFYSDNDRTGYIGTPDGWVPITGVQVVTSIPAWNEAHIGRLFFQTEEQQLYVGTAEGFEKTGAGGTGEDIEPDTITVEDTAGSPPDTPETNETYTVSTSGATDEWAGHEGQIAVWDGGSWAFQDPLDYQRTFINETGEYQVWVDDKGEWKAEVEETCFNYTDASFYPKQEENIPSEGAFFELDTDSNLMPVDSLPGYINAVWEQFGPNGLMPRP